jgi:DNA-binding PadR family transcriptional regulator
MASRPKGRLLDIEYSILDVVTGLARTGHDAYGFAIARHLAATSTGDGLIGHGTLYKALARLVTMSLLTASWEDASVGESEGRPRRRLYTITNAGAVALATRPADLTETAAAPARTALA